ncbi:MAG: hypothetical protein CM1200mP15_23110 [Dehalococcoidia bacterium]|nr:MAG: hypothetical protein CM1200mP15_23110 [Dehalococcoidia bacterium]
MAGQFQRYANNPKANKAMSDFIAIKLENE